MTGLRKLIRKYLTMTIAAAAMTGVTVGCATEKPGANQPASAAPVSVAPVSGNTGEAPLVPKPRHTEATASVHPAVTLGLHNSTKPSVSVPILEYHDITYIPNDPWAMSAQQFSDEMQFLSTNGFHPITLDQFYAAKYRGTKLPSRPIVLTFDDGYESNYTNAFPVLQKYGFHATIFVVSGFINRKGMLSGQELMDMESGGLVEIEAHTVHHPDLTKLTNQQVTDEVVQSKQTITQLLRRPVEYFCYPYGGYNGQTIRDLRKAGYLMAVCSDPGYASLSDNPYTLHRMAVHGGVTLDQFARMLSLSLTPKHV